MNIKELIEKLKEFPEDMKVGIQISTYKEGGKTIEIFSSVVFDIDEGLLPNVIFLKTEDKKHKEEYVNLRKLESERGQNEHSKTD